MKVFMFHSKKKSFFRMRMGRAPKHDPKVSPTGFLQRKHQDFCRRYTMVKLGITCAPFKFFCFVIAVVFLVKNLSRGMMTPAGRSCIMCACLESKNLCHLQTIRVSLVPSVSPMGQGTTATDLP